MILLINIGCDSFEFIVWSWMKIVKSSTVFLCRYSASTPTLVRVDVSEEFPGIVGLRVLYWTKIFFFIIHFYAIVHRRTIVHNKIINIICSCSFFVRLILIDLTQ